MPLAAVSGRKVYCEGQGAASSTAPTLDRELADEIPNAPLMTLRSGAHLGMAEYAQQPTEAVLRFLAEAR